MPDIWEGKNIADFVDPEIMSKLEALEKEEEEREQNGFYKLDALEYDSGQKFLYFMKTEENFKTTYIQLNSITPDFLENPAK